jgi:hypothetical protein
MYLPARSVGFFDSKLDDLEKFYSEKCKISGSDEVVDLAYSMVKAEDLDGELSDSEEKVHFDRELLDFSRNVADRVAKSSIASSMHRSFASGSGC